MAALINRPQLESILAKQAEDELQLRVRQLKADMHVRAEREVKAIANLLEGQIREKAADFLLADETMSLIKASAQAALSEALDQACEEAGMRAARKAAQLAGERLFAPQ